MHAAVSTYQMGRPSLALSYSVKYKGVLGSGLGMNDLIIEADNDAVWQNNEIVDQVNNKINHIIDNYNQLIVNIKDKLPEVKQMISLQMDDITNKLN
jgi:colanic acid/amylovoran biosynthesis protein